MYGEVATFDTMGTQGSPNFFTFQVLLLMILHLTSKFLKWHDAELLAAVRLRDSTSCAPLGVPVS